MQTGTCVYVEGVLAIPPVGAGIKQKIELRVKKVIDVGLVAAEYPLSRKSTILSIWGITFIYDQGQTRGCGEMFQVTTLLSEAEKLEKELMKNPPPSEADREAAKLFVKEKGEGVAKLKSKKASKEVLLNWKKQNRILQSLRKDQSLSVESCKRMERWIMQKISLLVKHFLLFLAILQVETHAMCC